MASPFPSTKYIPSSGIISNVVVTLTNLQPAANGNSWLMFLRSPAGTCVLLWNDQGVTQLINAAVTIVFDDGGGIMPVGPVPLPSGTYAPYNGAIQPVLTIPTTAPQPPYDFTLSAFNGEDKLGAWSLWICVRQNVATQISDGWDLTIT